MGNTGEYCKTCGKKLEHYANRTGYSEITGEPLYSLWRRCCDIWAYKHDVSEQEANIWYPPKVQGKSFFEKLLDVWMK